MGFDAEGMHFTVHIMNAKIFRNIPLHHTSKYVTEGSCRRNNFQRNGVKEIS